MNELKLTYEQENNALAYRANGVLLARLPLVTGHKNEHMIPVVKRLREYTGQDIGTKPARAIWDARKVTA